MNLKNINMDSNQQVNDSVYNILKANIMSLNLKPGDRISEQVISNILNVSRTPVREAIIQLTKEGLVYVLPQRGTFISKISLEAVDNARFLRLCFELEVVQLVAEIIDDETIKILEDNINRQKEALSQELYDEMFRLDQELHRTISKVINREGAWETIVGISTHYIMARVLSLIGKISWEKAIQQHVALLDAFKAHDREKASEVIRNHLANLRVDENAIKAKYANYFLEQGEVR